MLCRDLALGARGVEPWSLKGRPLRRRKPPGQSSSSPQAVAGSGLGVALGGWGHLGARGRCAGLTWGRGPPTVAICSPDPGSRPWGGASTMARPVGVQSPHSWGCSGPGPSFILTPILPLGLPILTFYFRYILNVNTVLTSTSCSEGQLYQQSGGGPPACWPGPWAAPSNCRVGKEGRPDPESWASRGAVGKPAQRPVARGLPDRRTRQPSRLAPAVLT